MFQSLFLLVFTLTTIQCDVSRIVNIEQGAVKGYLSDGIFSFYGIPYATSPKGRHRFKAPLPPPKFNETFEATNFNIRCAQTNHHEIEENCLVANIFVPNTIDTNLPVLVFIHGGGFQRGSGNRSFATNLIKSKNIIYVTFNYRLGAHGFLCLGTKDIPGNAGMKDQVTLLRWVHKNIGHFGGNVDEITVYGSSAGSRSVDLLLLSKATKNLITGVIADSGSGLAFSSVQIDPLENAKKFARMVNFTDVDDINALENFYLTASYDTLTSIDLMNMQDFLFTPCVERFVGEEVFLDESPLDILKKGDYPKLPILQGYTDMEGSFRIGVFPIWKDEMNSNFSNFLPHDLHFSSQTEKEEVAKRVRELYFQDNEITEDNIILFLNYFGDIMYVYPTLRALKLHLEANHDQVFLYEYSFTSEESPRIPYIDQPAAFHTMQTQAVLDYEDETKISIEFQKMKGIIRDLWHNFLIARRPVVEGSDFPAWSPIQPNRFTYMSLNHTLELRNLQHRALFWEGIYEKYYCNPIPPPDYNTASSISVTLFSPFVIFLLLENNI